jgi:preprotein translocase subunit SecG
MFWTNTLIDILLVVYVIDCIFMGLVIMMQRSKQEGLGAAFGGGFTDSIWGAQTSNVLVKATVWAAIIFFVLSITLARLYSHRAALTNEVSPVLQQLTAPVAVPAKPAAPTTNAVPVTPSATIAPAATSGTTAPAATTVTTPASSAPAQPTTTAPSKPASK